MKNKLVKIKEIRVEISEYESEGDVDIIISGLNDPEINFSLNGKAATDFIKLCDNYLNYNKRNSK